MKKNNIKKMAIMLAMVEALTLSACKDNKNIETSANTTKSSVEYWYDEEGNLHGLKAVDPIVTYVMLPYTSTRSIDGKTEQSTAYYKKAIYSAPSNTIKIEGVGSDMKCYVDYIYNQDTILENSDELKLTK